MITKRFEFNMLPVNTYVISDEASKEAAIIDAGCYYKREQETLANYIQDNHLKVKYLLNTHLHFDHIFGNRFVYKQYGLKTCAHRADEDWLTDAPRRTLMFGLQFPGEPVEIGTYIDEGDIFLLGDYKLECIHVPGHSQGSIVFHAPQAGCLFSGDVLFRCSIGRSDLPGGDGLLLIEGIQQKLLPLPDKTIVYAGHGDETTIGFEKQYNPYLRG